MRNRGKAPAVLAAVAVTAAAVASCSSGGGGHGATAGKPPIEGVDRAVCAAVSKQVSGYRVTDQTSGQNINAGALRHASGDQWAWTGPLRMNGQDPVDVIPWLKLTNPGSAPVECRSPVPGGGPKPYTEILLFPANQGVQASVRKQFLAGQDNSRYSFNGVGIGSSSQVSDGALQVATLSDTPVQNQYGDVDVDILTAFSQGASHYVVLYRDPAITGIAQEAPNSGPDGAPAPAANYLQARS
jgi:hypothetical protein